MTAQPAEEHQDPIDPRGILADLPDGDRAFFLSQYRQHVTAAVDPEMGENLLRFLRLWRAHADAARSPGYAADREAARNGTGGGMLLEDFLRMRRSG